MQGLPRNVVATALLAGVVSLMFELLQVKLLSFFIGKSMDVLAIPIALLGLAIGSMFRHFAWRGDPRVLLDRASVATLPVAAVSLLALFAAANLLFPNVHVAYATPGTEAAKIAVYGLVGLPPYVLFGALLSTLFASHPEHIGGLYFADLAGAAIGCALLPVLLTWLGLPAAIAGVLLAAFALGVARAGSTRIRARLTGLLAVLLIMVATGIGFREHVNPTVLASVFGDLVRQGAREADVRWNAIARTSLLTHAGRESGRYVVVQDNGLSNVQVTPWREEPRPEALIHNGQRALPWRMGLEPEDILVTFAGMGRDMVMMDELAGGTARITGVELNPTVVAWASRPDLAHTRLPAFLARPGIRLLAREGRDFLNTDAGQYDLIFVANNGAVHAGRTGHTRKFLDTEEAMEAYLARLKPGGMLMFMNQPVMEKLRSLRAIWQRQGRRDFTNCVSIFGDDAQPMMDTLLFKPDAMSMADRAVVAEAATGWGLAPLMLPNGHGVPRIERILHAPLRELPATTDDRPFTQAIDWRSFRILPDPDRVASPVYVSGWAKIFTVVLFALVSAVVALVAAGIGTPEQRVPARWVVYLLLSGVGYMCVQIPLIAKTELLVGNPLYAVSVNLAVFLVFNALGARAFETRRPRQAFVLAGAVAVATAGALLAMSATVGALLSTPLVVKIACVALFVGPVAFVMGMFYPWCVSELTRQGREAAIPMTYGLTTLASVLGSAFAMAAVVNLGFTRVIALGVALYVASALPGMRR
ncbi:MAG: hypothetical protein H6737_31145 [Alphaproteobacteria bacterium]|nr:hypothetical protein [Alphaproteobacteria bacterium]